MGFLRVVFLSAFTKEKKMEKKKQTNQQVSWAS